MIFKRPSQSFVPRTGRRSPSSWRSSIVGVFIGTQVTNWNAGAPGTAANASGCSTHLKPELQQPTRHSTLAPALITRRPAATPDSAFAGWRGDRGSATDDFVIAAYQASQIYGDRHQRRTTGRLIFGGDQLSDDRRSRMSATICAVILTCRLRLRSNSHAVATPLSRTTFGAVIPIDVQDAHPARNVAIATVHRDRSAASVYLPDRCALQLDRSTRQPKRPRPSVHTRNLPTNCSWHMAALASYLANMHGVRNEDENARKPDQALD